MQALGFNYRLTDLQAALGVSQLSRLAQFKARRRQIVARYNAAFEAADFLTVPFESPKLDSAVHLYVLGVDFMMLGMSRAEAMEQLREQGIGSQVHYIPLHLQPFYRENFGFKEGDFPKAERYYERELSIPLYPHMSDSDVDRVIDAVLDLENDRPQR
jgi:dTDP-4-amino-4,6-dideoxygalactose transaminase